MASRAEGVGLAPAPSLPRVLRAALSDFYFNSGRLVAANVAWGGGVVALWLVSVAWPLGAIVLAPLLALPGAAVFAVAARIVRGGVEPSVRDAFGVARSVAGPALLVGGATLVAAIVLGTNMVVGLTQAEPIGWAFGTFAAWGLLVVGMWTAVAWPLLVDPTRAGQRVRDRFRLAGLLVVAFPLRIAALAVVLLVVALVSTVLTAAILTVSLGYLALVACRYVYPAADRLEHQLRRAA